MSTNERDWFAPRNDHQPEDPAPAPSAFPPPPAPADPAAPPGSPVFPAPEPPPSQPPAAGPMPPSPQTPPPGTGPMPPSPLPSRPRRRRTGSPRDRATPPPTRPTPPPGYGPAPSGPAPSSPAPSGHVTPPTGPAGAPPGRGGAQQPGPGMPGAGTPGGPGMPGGPGRGRFVHPDQQVWPPAPRESSGGSTQPLPAIRPGMTMPSPQRPPAAAAVPPPEQPPAAPQDAPPPRRRRLVLVAVGAAVASVVAMGLNTYDGYRFYDTTITDGIKVKEIAVAPGQSGKVHDIEWKAALKPVQAPQGSKHGPEVTWLKVDITQKLLDESSATMTAPPDKVKLADRAGRTWTVEFTPGDRPTDRLELGKEYTFEGMAIVPTPVANEVELSFRVSDYRSDTPTADFFKREKAGKPEADVLRFIRR
ncbi:hypothetical protein [Nonomuraea sp. NPDC005692]|uniref:hypothetical protein n=1 Tax=Nonomuraea sp. NPDC005692 TaxID=3157168 RepID=UPI0033EA40AF